MQHSTFTEVSETVILTSSQQSAPRSLPLARNGGQLHREKTIGQKIFEQLRDECLQSGELYQDPDFPASDRSVFQTRFPATGRSSFQNERYMREFEWKRPPELLHNPCLIVDGAKRFDIIQGELGDCWLLAAVADLTLNEALLSRVVPHDQGFTEAEKYCGIFHFRFWRYGEWVDVVIDDRLPTVEGRLMFMQSRDTNEFWSALLEKAYAKINGSYESLKGGLTSAAMEDFTGGLAEHYDVKKAPSDFYTLILKSFELGAMMACSIDATESQLERRLPNGLIMGHAYSVTDVKLIDVMTSRSGKVPCLRLRNPWGAVEWKGAFSDESIEWKFVPDNAEEKLEVTVAEDGEFWIPFADVLTNFDKLEICNLGPETMVSADASFARKHSVTWEANVFSGSWTKGVSAGGCRNFLDTFHLNPQYQITLRETDGADGLANCIIALMQKDSLNRKYQGREWLTIGFGVYLLSEPGKAPVPLNRDFFRYNASVARSGPFTNSRQVTVRIRLPPGNYCIVPSTFNPNEQGDFLLRTYSEVPIKMAEHDHPAAEIFSVVVKSKRLIPPTNHVEQRLKMIRMFEEAAGADMEIDAKEFSLILNQGLKTSFDYKGFNEELVRGILAMSDLDYSGKLGVDEFISLWATIKEWKDIFATYDKLDEGKIRMENLREAMESTGYLVNNHMLRVFALRYGQPDLTITFEDFIFCIVRLQRTIRLFQAKDELNLKSAVFSLDDWILNTMYS